MLKTKSSPIPLYSSLLLEMLVTTINGRHDFACMSYTNKDKWMIVPAVDALIAA